VRIVTSGAREVVKSCNVVLAGRSLVTRLAQFLFRCHQQAAKLRRMRFMTGTAIPFVKRRVPFLAVQGIGQIGVTIDANRRPLFRRAQQTFQV